MMGRCGEYGRCGNKTKRERDRESEIYRDRAGQTGTEWGRERDVVARVGRRMLKAFSNRDF